MVHRFQEIFSECLGGSLSELLDLKQEAKVSYFMDLNPVQDSFRYRARRLALLLANKLINEDGELNTPLLVQMNSYFHEWPHFIGPDREGDDLIYGHIRTCLKRLVESKEIWVAIRKFSSPVCHKRAEEIIRETLWPDPIKRVETFHVRRAVFASWLTLLRQTTGSCFATAPAILIQSKCPKKFFKDLYDLLSAGQLKRTVAGKEYTVPLSLSSGLGDLQKVSTGLRSLPGIWAALESVGLRLSQGEIDQQVPQTPEAFLRTFLLEQMNLTEDDLQQEEYLSRIQMTPLLAKQTAVYYQRPTERGKKVSEWKKMFAKACTTFKAITECALLRCWEYTIASFCDVKTDFTRWNLYIGLGIHPEEKGGVGAFLYEQINLRLQKSNQRIQQLEIEYEQQAKMIRSVEALMHEAVSEIRHNQLKAELMAYVGSIHGIIDLKNREISKAEGLTQFFPSLLSQYDQKLQDHFQELFDPAVLGDSEQIYEDSPAGFRLVYKHGREDASQWTSIYTAQQYIDSLREFFSNVEADIIVPPGVGKEILSELTTSLIQYIQEEEFIVLAKKRARAKGKSSPWDYISGGTLQTLLAIYWNREKPFTEKKVIPANEKELSRFLNQLKKDGPLLMHSPTHAFVFHPTLMREDSGEALVQEWDEGMQEHLAHQISIRLPEKEQPLFFHLLRKNPIAKSNAEFREALKTSLPKIKNAEALVDAVLYHETPLFPLTNAKEWIKVVCKDLGLKETGPELYPNRPDTSGIQIVGKGSKNGAYFGWHDLYEWIVCTALINLGTSFSCIDWHEKIIESMRKFGLAQPRPILFADTNWSSWLFGFVANPVTRETQLWRLNRVGTAGFPMTESGKWFGKENIFPWIVLEEDKEYIENSFS